MTMSKSTKELPDFQAIAKAQEGIAAAHTEMARAHGDLAREFARCADLSNQKEDTLVREALANLREQVEHNHAEIHKEIATIQKQKVDRADFRKHTRKVSGELGLAQEQKADLKADLAKVHSKLRGISYQVMDLQESKADFADFRSQTQERFKEVTELKHSKANSTDLHEVEGVWEPMMESSEQKATSWSFHENMRDSEEQSTENGDQPGDCQERMSEVENPNSTRQVPRSQTSDNV